MRKVFVADMDGDKLSIFIKQYTPDGIKQINDDKIIVTGQFLDQLIKIINNTNYKENQ